MSNLMGPALYFFHEEISEKWSGKTMIRELDGLWIEIIMMATSKAGSNCGHLPESLIPGLSGGFAHPPMGKER